METLMDTRNIYLARQPIVDRSGELVGYELLFRATDEESPFSHDDDTMATSTVIANAFAEIGLTQVIGPYVGHLNIDQDFLYSDLVEALPADRIVLELYEKKLDERSLERLAELRRQGYRIALDDFVGNFDGFDELLPAVDLVKVDFQRIDALLVPVIVDMLKKHKVRMIAQKVETPEQFELAKSLGMDLFQGFHFARPQLITARREKPAKLALLRLLSLAMEDAETHAIESEFKRHPHLSVNLMRLVNSAACSRGQSITSLRHALVLLGRRQLRVWLQLLLYTADRGNKSLGSPLLQLAAARGKLMEQLASRKPGPDSVVKELAFITGILSLMDVLLEMSHEDILKQLNLPAPVKAALLNRDGEIGDMLSLTEHLERDSRADVHDAVQKLGGVPANELMDMQIAAFEWANQVSAESAH
jgi:EAL and modified HD-GYP domain-containing signal transduction protein